MKMEYYRRRGGYLLVFQRSLAFLIVIFTIMIHLQLVNAVSNPIGARYSPFLTPPQVLLPPHREEGQSLDDIIYGTSFSGSVLSNFPFLKNAPVDVPRPNPSSSTPPSFSSSSPSFRNNNNNNLNLNKPLPPSPPTSQQTRTFNNNQNNFNLVQTFTPSSPPPPPPRSNSIFPSPSISGSTSAEEIKIPQAVKHRTNRKQYTKADLIAAANSLKPAGFDFSKVLIVTPSNNHLNSSNNGNNDPTTIYKQVRQPLPLFDTPVYNLMEMLLKARFNLGSGSGGVDDNKKVLVIIPKGSSGQPSGRSANPLLNNSKPSLKHQLQSSATTTTSSSTKSSPSNNKFHTILPKPSSPLKHQTTQKPKSFSQGFTTTTKRASKITPLSPPVSIATNNPHSNKHNGKKTNKGPDLQAAATSNKLSQRPSPGGSSTSGAASDKRTYSSKGGDNYSFSYAVKNDAYKDVKSHSESRDGDSVAGEYSMLEADGYTRVVRYTVDSDQGFKASVKRIPPSIQK